MGNNQLENDTLKLTPFWRKLNIIIPIIAVLITSLASIVTIYYHREKSDEQKLFLYDQKQYEKIKLNPTPLFLVSDFLTFNDNADTGKIISDMIMQQMYRRHNNKIRIMERVPTVLVTDFFKKAKTQTEYFTNLQELGAIFGVTHILDGRVNKEGNSISVRLYSCISKQLIFINSIEMKKISIDNSSYIKLADSIVDSATIEIKNVLSSVKK